jgi:hypothetical protein
MALLGIQTHSTRRLLLNAWLSNVSMLALVVAAATGCGQMQAEMERAFLRGQNGAHTHLLSEAPENAQNAPENTLTIEHVRAMRNRMLEARVEAQARALPYDSRYLDQAVEHGRYTAETMATRRWLRERIRN